MEQYNDTAPERRDAERLAVNLSVVIHRYRTPPVLCTMHDISTGGALLTTYDDHELAAGDEILVEAGTAEFVATIAWIAKDSCGIRFHRRLYATEVAAMLSVDHDNVPHDGFSRDVMPQDDKTEQNAVEYPPAQAFSEEDSVGRDQGQFKPRISLYDGRPRQADRRVDLTGDRRGPFEADVRIEFAHLTG